MSGADELALDCVKQGMPQAWRYLYPVRGGLWNRCGSMSSCSSAGLRDHRETFLLRFVRTSSAFGVCCNSSASAHKSCSCMYVSASVALFVQLRCSLGSRQVSWVQIASQCPSVLMVACTLISNLTPARAVFPGSSTYALAPLLPFPAS